MLISEEYKRLNEELHATNEGYGGGGSKWVRHIAEMAEGIGTQDILDYGCGKGTLSMHFPFTIQQYDPAIPRFSDLPKPADLVVCTDVLEHIEPESLDDVLEHLHLLTKKALFAVVHTGEAAKTLSDGRNAHLSIHPPQWWMNKLYEKFNILNFMELPGGVMIAAEPK